MRSTNFSSDSGQNFSQERIEEPFFKHAREDNILNCVQMSHGLFITFMMISLRFTGQQFQPEDGDIWQLQLPGFLSKSYFAGNNPADYFEPLYMFWIGFNIQMSINRSHKKTLTLWMNLLMRLITMLLIGFFINSILCNFNYTHYRVMGFFQRIIIMNFLIIILHLYADRKIQYFLVLLFFLAFLGLITTVKNDSCLENHINIADPNCNGICYLDSKILTPNHMQYQQFDSDGLFSTLNVLFISYVGYSFGKILKLLGNKNLKRLLMYWIIGSIVLGLIGYISKITWPFVPAIYSTNFTMFSAGVAGLFLLLLYVIFDLLNKKYTIISKIFYPLLWFGKNGLFLFGIRCLLEAIFLQEGVTHKIVNKISIFPGDEMNGLFYNFLFYLLFLFISFCLHKTNVTIRF